MSQADYGTFDYSCGSEGKSDMPVLEAEIAMRALADQRAFDGASTHSNASYDSAQAGVKRVEAISSTWSRSGLLVAYLG